MADALARWPDDRPDPGVRAAAGALALAAAVGGPAADAVDALAHSLADQHAALAEARAQSAQARGSALVMLIAPLVYLVFAGAFDQHAVAVLAGTGVGRMCVLVAAVLDAIGWWWIRRLIGTTGPRA